MSRTIAILLTVHNRRELTLACLRAVGEQQLLVGDQLKVFLVDDGSDDGTTETVNAEFPNTKVISGTGQLFWTGGMHLADTHSVAAEPAFQLWLNDDVKLYPHAIKEMIQTSHMFRDKAIVAGAVRDDQTGKLSYGGYRRLNRRRPLHFTPCIPGGDVQIIDTMNGNVVLVPRAVRASVGPLDLHFSHNMADQDYGLRACDLGYSVVLAPTFVGTCELNKRKTDWANPNLSLMERLTIVRSRKAFPPREWIRFVRRHGGWRWPAYFLSPYIRAVLAHRVVKG